MSWGLAGKRASEVFHLTLNYGTEETVGDHTPISSSASTSSSTRSSSASSNQDQELGVRIDLDWTAGDDEDQVALRLQSQLMVALPMPQDTVAVELTTTAAMEAEGVEGNVGVDMKVVRRREPLRAVVMRKMVGSGQQSDGFGVLTRLLRSNFVPPGDSTTAASVGDGLGSYADHWMSITVLSLCGCGMLVSVFLNLYDLFVLDFFLFGC